MSRAVLDRSAPPAPGPLRPFAFPRFERHALGCGLAVLLARLPRVPTVALELYLPAGAQHDPPRLPGLATLTAAMLDEGTASRAAAEIAALIERLGGSLRTGAGWNASYVGATLLAKDLDVGLDLVAEVALAPSFPDDELERLRQRRLGLLLQRRNDPGALAGERFARTVYGDAVYGQPLLGDEASTAAITRAEVEGFFRRHATADGSFLVAVGDLDPETLLPRLEEAFAAMPSHPRAPRPAIEPRAVSAIEVHLVDRPQAKQTEMRLGHAGVERTHPDFARLQVLNAILGGKFTSRINLNLREKNGYTYGAHSRFVGRFGPGPFEVFSAVETDVAGAAVRETLGELRRIQQAPVEPEELSDAQSYLRGSFVAQLQSIDELATRLSAMALYGLPSDHYERYLREIETTTRDQLLALARRHLHPDRAAVVLVGPRAELEPQLEGLGPVTVHDPEA